ncbi:MAG: hypothetical protein R3211_11220 [Balneolaceae bacterium]|nr:hypothetical protein [Balneolaceae bacterium]
MIRIILLIQIIGLLISPGQVTSHPVSNTDSLAVDGNTSDLHSALGLGANFSFINGLESNNIYSDLVVNDLDLWNIGAQKRVQLGFELFITQGRSFTPSSKNRIQFFDPVITGGDTLSIPGRVDEEIISLSFLTSLTLKLPGIDHFYPKIATEIRQLEIREAINEDVSIPDSLASLTPLDPSVSSNTDSRWFAGAGGILVLDSEDVKAKIGINWGTTIFILENKTRRTFIGNFTIREKSIGLKLGGQIRDINKRDIEISLYLAKEFSLKKLAEVFRGG